MPSNYRVEIVLERTVTFYVAADSEADVVNFLEANSDWEPGDVPGLIDHVSDELETDYMVYPESTVVPGFEITEDLKLAEIE